MCLGFCCLEAAHAAAAKEAFKMTGKNSSVRKRACQHRFGSACCALKNLGVDSEAPGLMFSKVRQPLAETLARVPEVETFVFRVHIRVHACCQWKSLRLRDLHQCFHWAFHWSGRWPGEPASAGMSPLMSHQRSCSFLSTCGRRPPGVSVSSPAAARCGAVAG